MKLLFTLLTLTLAVSAEQPTTPQPVTLRAAVELGQADNVKLGKLTFGADSLEFDSPDLVFSLPVAAIDAVDVAGSREHWLRLTIDPTTPFARSYSFLLQLQHTPPSAHLQFLLPPGSGTDLKAALDVANRFADRVAPAALERTARRAPMTAAVPVAAAAAHPAPKPAVAPAPPPPQPKTLAVIGAGWLPKKPSLVMSGYGASGQLVFKENGIGFAFDNVQALAQSQVDALSDAGLFLPAEDTANVAAQDQKTGPSFLGRPQPPQFYFVILTPRLGSPSAARFRPFLDPNGALVFCIRNMYSRQQIGQLIAGFTASKFNQ